MTCSVYYVINKHSGKGKVFRGFTDPIIWGDEDPSDCVMFVGLTYNDFK